MNRAISIAVWGMVAFNGLLLFRGPVTSGSPLSTALAQETTTAE